VLVVDASVATLWFLPQSHSREARAVLSLPRALIAPALLQLEVGSALLRAVRRHEMLPEIARESVFDVLPEAVELMEVGGLLRQAYALASDYGGSLADAKYIALAKSSGALLITEDAQMHAVASRARVPARLLGDGPVS
jgi:predicted nucleic acid-binding protein